MKYTYDAKLGQLVPMVDHGPERPEPPKVVAPVVAPGAIPAPTEPPKEMEVPRFTITKSENV